MGKKAQTVDNKRFIEFVTQLKKNKHSYRHIDRVSGFREGFISDVILERSSASKSDVEKLLVAFPELSPLSETTTDINDIEERIERLEQENKELKDHILTLYRKRYGEDPPTK